MSEVELGRTGRLYSYTTTHTPVSHFQPPHSIGLVEIPEGLRVLAPLDGVSEDFAIGMEMELIIGPLWTEDDEEIVGFRYRPISLREESDG